MIKVLSIGSDRRIFEEGSAVRARMIEYGAKMGELHIVVFSKQNSEITNLKLEISSNIWVYSTYSSSRWLYIWDAIKIGKKIIQDSKFGKGNSVITAQDPFECGFVGWRIAQATGLPLHLQIHTDFLSPYFVTSPIQYIRASLAKFLLPKADGIRLVSKRIADSMEKVKIALKNPPTILPIRVDVEAIEKTPRGDIHHIYPQFKDVILMASRITPEKRIADALFAFKQVIVEYPLAGLVISGVGPELEKLKKVSVRLGLSKNVEFLGFRPDIFGLMKSSDIFLSTSEFEGYGMSLIEAGLAGCTVVSTNAGVAGGLLKDGLNASVCNVGDIDCLASKMKQLIADTALREILRGRLASDLRSTIPTKEEYINEYVKDLESISKKNA